MAAYIRKPIVGARVLSYSVAYDHMMCSAASQGAILCDEIQSYSILYQGI